MPVGTVTHGCYLWKILVMNGNVNQCWRRPAAAHISSPNCINKSSLWQRTCKRLNEISPEVQSAASEMQNHRGWALFPSKDSGVQERVWFYSSWRLLIWVAAEIDGCDPYTSRPCQMKDNGWLKVAAVTRRSSLARELTLGARNTSFSGSIWLVWWKRWCWGWRRSGTSPGRARRRSTGRTEPSGRRRCIHILLDKTVLVHETSQWVSAHQRIHHLWAESNRSRVHGTSHRPTLTHVPGDLRGKTRVKGETGVQIGLYKRRVGKASPSGWPSPCSGWWNSSDSPGNVFAPAMRTETSETSTLLLPSFAGAAPRNQWNAEPC